MSRTNASDIAKPVAVDTTNGYFRSPTTFSPSSYSTEKVKRPSSFSRKQSKIWEFFLPYSAISRRRGYVRACWRWNTSFLYFPMEEPKMNTSARAALYGTALNTEKISSIGRDLHRRRNLINWILQARAWVEKYHIFIHEFMYNRCLQAGNCMALHCRSIAREWTASMVRGNEISC